jgi:membrane protease subunit (stomatin/prohibitin family)
MLETASGILIPAAKNVRPITESGIFKVSPTRGKLYFITASDTQGIKFRTAHKNNIFYVCFLQDLQ